MSGFSRALIGRSGYVGEDFTAVYDAYRPVPPEALLEVLTFLTQAERFRLVVDVGAGTGLSTRVWAALADEVVGVEPNHDMIEHARRATHAANVRYVEAFADGTGLPEGRADLVTCAQAFHWMEPAPVLVEAERLLRRGGIFAAYDYDVPPAVHPDVDQAFAEHFSARRAARSRLGLEAGAVTWPKERHIEQIRESGRFRIAREIVCHGWSETDVTRLVGLAESVGGPRELFGGEAPKVEETFARLGEVARSALGSRTWPMLLCYRIRLGIR